MRKCLRCEGQGARPAIIHTRPEASCWICQGFGKLAPPIAAEIMVHVITKHTPHHLRLEPPKPSYKEAMSMLAKPAPWGIKECTIAQANAAWRGTVLGRRCTYVWASVRLLKGQTKGVKVSKYVDILGTKHDPYKAELDAIIQEIRYK
jgi:hypothetical protein